MTDRELDALIAQKIMSYGTAGLEYCPHYSTNISDAWAVVEKTEFRLELTEYSKDDGPVWMAKFMGPGCVEGKAEDDSAPRAICLAALKAVGVEVKP